jgi:gag-polypeptide of LTR copia-type
LADRANDDRAVRPLAVFNGAMTGIRMNGDDGDSYAEWRARLIIYLRAKRLLSIATGNNDDDESDEEDNQPSARRRKSRASHIMTSALGTGPFMFVQGVPIDPAAIHRILDTNSQGFDTSAIMSAVNEFATKKYRPGQLMEMFIAEFEGLSMRLDAIGHGFSEQMRVVTFLNSLSQVSALSAVLSALRGTDKVSWMKATTQILLESDMKGANNKGREYPERAMVASTGFSGICYTCGEAAIAARITLIKVVIITVIRQVMERVVQETTLIVAMVIVALTIVKVLEVRAKGVLFTLQDIMNVLVKKMTSVVTASQTMAATMHTAQGQHLPSAITATIASTTQTCPPPTITSTTLHHSLQLRTTLVTKFTLRQLWSILVPRGTCSTTFPSSRSSSS